MQPGIHCLCMCEKYLKSAYLEFQYKTSVNNLCQYCLLRAEGGQHVMMAFDAVPYTFCHYYRKVTYLYSTEEGTERSYKASLSLRMFFSGCLRGLASHFPFSLTKS